MIPSNDELQEIIDDAKEKIGDYHALIMSKEIMVAALKELMWYRANMVTKTWRPK